MKCIKAGMSSGGRGGKPSMSTPANIPAEVAEMIDAFSRDADGIVNAFAQTLEDKPPPEIIYHYTNDIGMRGILETGKIWLTDVFSLNDPSELRHGCDLAVGALTHGFNEDRPEIEQFCCHLAEMLRLGIEEIAHFFTCSFSETGDDLGQWRAYADDGHGFALGFDAATLEKAFVGSISGPNFMTFPISYREVLLRADLRKGRVLDIAACITFKRACFRFRHLA